MPRAWTVEHLRNAWEAWRAQTAEVQPWESHGEFDSVISGVQRDAEKAVLLEVATWAGRKRDRGTPGPTAVMSGRDLERWRDGYTSAMNEVAQHFNMRRLGATEATDG